jgi:translation initiation factor eIF-2B subunit gamma
LPEVRELVTGDFIVLPCDLVCELAGEQLLQAWMVKSASLTGLLGTKQLSNGHQSRYSGGLGVWYNTKASAPVKGEETDFIATAPLASSPTVPPKGSIFPNVSKLVYSIPTDSFNDLVEERKAIPIRHGLMKANPRVRMYTTHRDAHIYIFPRWVLDFIKKNERLESIGEDVVGWWAKAGWQAGLADKLLFGEVCRNGDDDSEEDGSELGGRSSPAESAPDNQENSREAASSNTTRNDKNGSAVTASTFEPPPILAYIHSHKEEVAGSIVRRVDTAQLLLAVSLQLAKLPSIEEADSETLSPFAHPRKVAYPEGVKPRTTITKQDSLIAENVTVEEKTSIKETVIGAGCQINEGAKLSQCLLMENVIIGKGCKLTRCILGKRCIIGAGSVLTDCEVQENLIVEPRSEYFPFFFFSRIICS